jgi:hypothetical protein
LWAKPADSHHDARQEARHPGGMNASPKLQRAARVFLLRRVAENVPEEAAAILRRLTDEIESLEREELGYDRNLEM